MDSTIIITIITTIGSIAGALFTAWFAYKSKSLKSDLDEVGEHDNKNNSKLAILNIIKDAYIDSETKFDGFNPSGTMSRIEHSLSKLDNAMKYVESKCRTLGYNFDYTFVRNEIDILVNTVNTIFKKKESL